MSTATLEAPVLAPAVPMDRLYRFPLDTYRAMVARGILDEHANAVFLDGLLVTKMTRHPPHVIAAIRAFRTISALLPPGWDARKEDPVTLPSGPTGYPSEPEPDVAVVRGTIEDYRENHPGPADVALIVEVAATSLREDRAGLERLAWSGIPIVWIVNLEDRMIEVYSHPSGPVSPAKYRDVTIYGDDAEVPLVIDGQELGKIPVREVLP